MKVKGRAHRRQRQREPPPHFIDPYFLPRAAQPDKDEGGSAFGNGLRRSFGFVRRQAAEKRSLRSGDLQLGKTLPQVDPQVFQILFR